MSRRRTSIHRPTGWPTGSPRPSRFRTMEFRPVGFRPLGFRPLGFRPLGFRPLGFPPGSSSPGRKGRRGDGIATGGPISTQPTARTVPARTVTAELVTAGTVTAGTVRAGTSTAGCVAEEAPVGPRRGGRPPRRRGDLGRRIAASTWPWRSPCRIRSTVARAVVPGHAAGPAVADKGQGAVSAPSIGYAAQSGPESSVPDRFADQDDHCAWSSCGTTRCPPVGRSGDHGDRGRRRRVPDGTAQ